MYGLPNSNQKKQYQPILSPGISTKVSRDIISSSYFDRARQDLLKVRKLCRKVAQAVADLGLQNYPGVSWIHPAHRLSRRFLYLYSGLWEESSPPVGACGHVIAGKQPNKLILNYQKIYPSLRSRLRSWDSERELVCVFATSNSLGI